MANSITLAKYKKTMADVIRLYYSVLDIPDDELNMAIDYSISKRYKEYVCEIDNNYTKTKTNTNLLMLADYINSREPIVTSFGTMFRKHEELPNPLATVIQQFLDARKVHKKQMFKYPKGSEMFEHFNLMQQLSKIDVNGKPIYAALS